VTRLRDCCIRPSSLEAARQLPFDCSSSLLNKGFIYLEYRRNDRCYTQALKTVDSARTDSKKRYVFQWKISRGHVQLEQRPERKTQQAPAKSKGEKDTKNQLDFGKQ